LTEDTQTENATADNSESMSVHADENSKEEKA
jgi:hypothetical protein